MSYPTLERPTLLATNIGNLDEKRRLLEVACNNTELNTTHIQCVLNIVCGQSFIRFVCFISTDFVYLQILFYNQSQFFSDILFCIRCNSMFSIILLCLKMLKL